MAKSSTSFQKGHKVNVGKKNRCTFTKLKEHDLVEKAYISYCDHIAKGRSACSWYFVHPKVKVAYEAFQNYFEKFPEEFEEMDRKIAWSKGYRYWEDKIEDASCRPSRETNPAVLQMIMRNKFKWDSHQFGEGKAPDKFDAQLKVLKQVEGEWKEV